MFAINSLTWYLSHFMENQWVCPLLGLCFPWCSIEILSVVYCSIHGSPIASPLWLCAWLGRRSCQTAGWTAPLRFDPCCQVWRPLVCPCGLSVVLVESYIIDVFTSDGDIQAWPWCVLVCLRKAFIIDFLMWPRQLISLAMKFQPPFISGDSYAICLILKMFIGNRFELSICLDPVNPLLNSYIIHDVYRGCSCTAF